MSNGSGGSATSRGFVWRGGRQRAIGRVLMLAIGCLVGGGGSSADTVRVQSVRGRHGAAVCPTDPAVSTPEDERVVPIPNLPSDARPLILVRYGWFCGSHPPDGTKPVGALLPNAFGLHDTYGNVWEWCEDYWHDGYAGAPLDGSPWLSPPSGQRVMRGGYWGSNPRFCDSASRGRRAPDSAADFSGFRIVLEIRGM